MAYQRLRHDRRGIEDDHKEIPKISFMGSLDDNDPNAPPLMFVIVCGAITSSIIEFILGQAAEKPKEYLAEDAFRAQRLMRWMIRRYGPDTAKMIITSVFSSPAKAANAMGIAKVGDLVVAIIKDSVEDIMTYEPA